MSFLRGLARYTPLDRTIRSGMFKATLGFDPFSAPGRRAAPLPIGGMRGGQFAGKGPLEMFGPKPDSIGAPFRREAIQRASQRNQSVRAFHENRPIPTGLSQQAAAKRGQSFSYSPPPLSKRDQALAAVLSKRPRRGG